ncbi:MAG: hypothetical protein R3E95_09160 [Thiolinea sp.]
MSRPTRHGYWNCWKRANSRLSVWRRSKARTTGGSAGTAGLGAPALQLAGHSIREIADSLNEKEETVKSRLRYARNRLKQLLAADDASAAGCQTCGSYADERQHHCY